MLVWEVVIPMGDVPLAASRDGNYIANHAQSTGGSTESRECPDLVFVIPHVENGGGTESRCLIRIDRLIVHHHLLQRCSLLHSPVVTICYASWKPKVSMITLTHMHSQARKSHLLCS